MNTYVADQLKAYIEKSNLIIINDDFKIRLSHELLNNYKQNLYLHALSSIEENINKIKALNIEYPANAKPIFYLYIVPNENFSQLLNFPKNRSTKGGGKPVSCYDLDGFNEALGVSSNILENETDSSIMKTVNSIHELAHLVHSMFFRRNRFIEEGFAEALPLYTMDYESEFKEYRDLLKSLKKSQILSAQELIVLGEKNEFNSRPLVANASCSFELPYISSYLFVKGCLTAIEKKYNVNRIQATQKFLEIIKQSPCWNQWLVYDIANAIDLSQEELLNGKDMQFDTIKNLD